MSEHNIDTILQLLKQKQGGKRNEAKNETIPGFLGGLAKHASELEKFSPNNVMQAYDHLTGLNNFKNLLMNLTHLAKCKHMHKRMNIAGKRSINSLNFIFSGNAGTGKTTAAKLIGKTLKHIGLLSSGHTILFNYEELLSKYFGELEARLIEAIDKARNGVLIIDDISAILKSTDTNNTAINSFLAKLDKMESEICVIITGRPEDCKRFLLANPDVQNRFPFEIKFEDLNSCELLTIFINTLLKRGLILDSKALKLSTMLFEHKTILKNSKLDNARYCSNIVDSIVLVHSNRLATNNKAISKTELKLIRSEDIINLVKTLGISTMDLFE